MNYPYKLPCLLFLLWVGISCSLDEIADEVGGNPNTSSCEGSTENLSVDFTINNGGCQAPCTISLENNSVNASTYSWDFGDGSRGEGAFPTHEYTKAGSYNITLVASNGECQDSLIKTVNIEWLTFETTFGGSGRDFGLSIIQALGGGYLISGRTTSIGQGNPNVYLLRTSLDGTLQWEEAFGGNAFDAGESIIQDQKGDIIISGATNSQGEGGLDAYLIKATNNGVFQWEKTFGGIEWDEGNSLVETPDGGFLIAGYTESHGSGMEDIFLVKTYFDGTIQWEEYFGGTNTDKAYSVIQNFNGDYIIIGETTSQGAGKSDIYLLNISNSGRLQWETTFGGSEDDFGKSIIQSTDGGYIIVGSTQSFGNGMSDVYLIKTSNNGTLEWEKTLGGEYWDEGNSVSQTTDGGYIIIGNTQGENSEEDDVYLIKTSPDGTLEWENLFGGMANEVGKSVFQLMDEGFIILGTTASQGEGNEDVYLIKTDDQGNVK